ncbi:NAD-dependent epimerase/dehydratase family protein, partial [Micrococcus luteus]|nr:NAD-dependent epimerase/dehydratase family protein [Micrococcus luteus]
GYVNLFGANDGYGNGEQTRDFVSVEDVAKVNLYFFDHPELSGIYNLGTGRSQQFNELAAGTRFMSHNPNTYPPKTLKTGGFYCKPLL